MKSYEPNRPRGSTAVHFCYIVFSWDLNLPQNTFYVNHNSLYLVDRRQVNSTKFNVNAEETDHPVTQTYLSYFLGLFSSKPQTS